jgi:hemerythrin-like domain-containing protein
MKGVAVFQEENSMIPVTRRQFIAGIGLLSAGVFLEGCEEQKRSKEVTAVEDLMREHGVLRRALFIYSEAAARLREDASSVPSDALQKTAKLFRVFGEDYHEKQLEEAHIFPAVRKAGGEAAAYPYILTKQHQQGREITDYILIMTREEKLDNGHAGLLASALDSFVRMYRPHAAREDTIVFPAWKRALSVDQLDEINDKFERIEHEMFGKKGFENAVQQISNIEVQLGLGDLAQFTAPPPPSR